jgi:hypothetical protein
VFCSYFLSGSAAVGNGVQRECVAVVSDLQIGGVSSLSTFFSWPTFLCHYTPVETRDDNVTGSCSSVLPTRRRFCVVGKNISALAPCLPPYCIASHEIIAVADFDGAENLIWTVSRYFTTRLIDVGSCKAARCLRCTRFASFSDAPSLFTISRICVRFVKCLSA